MGTTVPNPNDISAVVTSLTILEQMVEYGDAIGVSELSKRVGANKPKTYRHLRNLLENGYLDQDASTEKYYLTLKLFHLGQAIAARTDLLVEARRVMTRLKEQTGLTVAVGQVEKTGVRVLDIMRHRAQIEITTPPGTLFEFESSAQGKIAMAFAEGLDVDQALKNELSQIRECGWAVAPETILTGVNALASPIFDAQSHLIGTIAVVGSVQHLPQQPEPETISAVLNCANAVSERLGYRRQSKP